ncbi:MAG TPA: hypothetical protein PLL78_09950, partial [Fimbriimonadaceae bacterium]|nr:hypothetical protein [Fimbriimonadaceae bacterium]HRJ96998.1 hypothetical protein [Fimbriimonadaceae bacterium]
PSQPSPPKGGLFLCLSRLAGRLAGHCHPERSEGSPDQPILSRGQISLVYFAPVRVMGCATTDQRFRGKTIA